MPDLLTHFFIAERCRRATKGHSLGVWFLVGTVLPDVLTRPLTIPFPGLYWVVVPLHTPAGLLIVCALISESLLRQRQAEVFYNLIGGVALHLFLDFFQKHLGSGYYWLFPFSWASYEYGFFGSEASFYPMPLWLVIGIFFMPRYLLLRRAVRTIPLRVTDEGGCQHGRI
jgi:hypothetical protein